MSYGGRSAEDILWHMYESGEHSDFMIITKTKSFKVHRSIISQTSGFFEGICKKGFRENITGKVRVPEPAEVMNALLRHMYKATMDFSDMKDEYSLPVGGRLFRLVSDVHIAADKYIIGGLETSLADAYMHCAKDEATSLEDVAVMAVDLLRSEANGVLSRLSATTKPVLAVALTRLACQTRSLTESVEAWDLVRSHADCLERLFKCSMARAAWEATGTAEERQVFMDTVLEATDIKKGSVEHKVARLSMDRLLLRAKYRPNKETIRGRWP